MLDQRRRDIDLNRKRRTVTKEIAVWITG